MFTVTWTPSAEDDLAFIWINADSPQRREISRYAAEAIRHLHANADRIGESREEGGSRSRRINARDGVSRLSTRQTRHRDSCLANSIAPLHTPEIL